MTRSGALGRALDVFYNGCGVLAGISLVAIAVIVLLQIVARALGFVVSWTPEFAGYAMAASAFLALAYTFKTGGHIRVGMLINQVPQAGRRWVDVACLLLGLAIVGYFAWSATLMTWWSFRFNSVGQGAFPVPLWVPQSVMTFGIVALAVALADSLVRVSFRGEAPYREVETVSTH